MNKEKLFYAIGEVAKELNLEQHVLRFWESQFNQIKPIKCRGRRLYDRKCIEIIRKVKHMLYEEGYTIKGAQKEFKNRSLVEPIYDENSSREVQTIKHFDVPHEVSTTELPSKVKFFKISDDAKFNCDAEYLNGLLQEMLDLREYLTQKINNQEES